MEPPLKRGFFSSGDFSLFGAALRPTGFLAAVRLAGLVALVVLVAARLVREAPPWPALEDAALEVKNSPNWDCFSYVWHQKDTLPMFTAR